MDENKDGGKLKKVGNWVSAILLGNTRELIARIDERTMMMQKSLEDIKPKVDDMYPKVDILWKDKVAPAHSPRKLNEYGQKILKESSIKEIIDEKKATLLELVKAKGVTNAYDAEQAVLLVVKELPAHCPDVVDRLKNGAFNAGANLDTVLLVGGIYLRDLIFPDLGFSVEQLDAAKAS
jgi:hypothetical protein